MPQADSYYEVDIKDRYKYMSIRNRDWHLRNQLCGDCRHAYLVEGNKSKSGVVPYYRECKERVVPFKNTLYIEKKAINITLSCYHYEDKKAVTATEGWNTNE